MRPVPPRPKRGVSADRHDTWGAGCGGRDGVAYDWFVRTNGTEADAKACGPGLPTLRPSRAVTSRATTGARKPGPRGERAINVKTIAQGMPDDLAEPVVTAACLLFCRRAMGEAVARHSLRPLRYRGRTRRTTRAHRAARMPTHITPLSCPAKAGHPVFQRRLCLSRQAAAYWIARSRLRQGFGGATRSTARRSFSGGGEQGDDR
jgi:hypothetical protein